MVAQDDSVTKRIQRSRKMHSRLKTERTRLDDYWQDVSDFIHPGRYRRTRSDRQKKNLRLSSGNVIRDSASIASRTLKAGMSGGITPRTREWFRLTHPDAELAEQAAVKEWLTEVFRRMNAVFHKSNLYQMLPTMYGDAGSFGTGALILQDDPKEVIRFYDVPPGSYVISTDSRGQVNTFVRDLSMTVGQVVERFGLDNASDHVKKCESNGDLEEWVDVSHFVVPNPDWAPDRMGGKYKRFLSYYVEAGVNDKILGESGYDDFPVLVFTWDKTGEDVWGTECPGFTAMGAIKSLQHAKKRGAQAIDKKVDPPLVGTSSLANRMISRMPGGVTYVDTPDGKQGLWPLYQVNFDTRELREWGLEDEQFIREAFFVDLFLMFAGDTKTNRTATEIIQRQEEKMIVLGPTLERINEMLDQLIDRTFNIMASRGLIPDPPEEIAGQALKVEYVSIAAQAQKMIGLAALQETAAFVGSLAAVDPSVLDKFDMDQAVDEFSDIRGVNPRVIRADDQVEALRQARQQQEQAMAAQQQAAQAAQSAKLLSDADMAGDNALTRLVGGGAA